MIRIATILFFWAASALAQSTYVGSEACKTCHSGSIGNAYNDWKQTLHSKIHQIPGSTTITGDFTTSTTINMGASYSNAIVTVRTSGGKYYAKIGATGTEYEIAYTYGGGWKQRYLVKIDSSYYILPIQWNSNKYLDNTSGAWTTYTQATWFNADGTVKVTNNNSFRGKSWDKNCMGCHVSGYKVNRSVAAADTFWIGTWGAAKQATDINVGCESCHGPGSLHAGTGDKTKIMNPSKLTNNLRKLEVCGQCHNRASSWAGAGKVGSHEFGKNEIADTYFNPADTTHPLVEFMNFSTPPNATGGPGTWPDNITARQHHQQYQEWQTSAHFTNPFVPMNCFTCHDPHKGVNHQLRDSLAVGVDKFKTTNDDNTLCLSCHATSGPFKGIQKTWVKDVVANNDSIAKYVSAHTKHSVYDPTDKLKSGGLGRCSKCHMAKTATTAKSFDIHSHSFAVISPKKTLDLKTVSTASTKGMVNSCAASCHRNPAVGTLIPTFSVSTDASITDWSESTDLALADTLWKYYQIKFPTSVKQIAGKIPQMFELSQNYPNPFNPTTEIRFNVPQRSEVRLVIYNIVGQEVKSLVNSEMDAGTYAVKWNGKNDYGEYAASGIYLYRLESENFTQTKKMILAK